MRSISAAVVASLLSLFVWGQAAPPQAPDSSKAPAKATTPAPSAKAYIGSAVCESCHEDIVKAFQKDPHKSIDFDRKRGREEHACESCHGPASMHIETVSAEDIINPAKLTGARLDETCLTCHRNQATHIGRIQGGHAKNRVSCIGCHQMHKPEAESLVSRKPASINKQCTACHTSEWASFQRPHSHRLPQNAMSCTDCHNPHGSFLGKQLQTFAANETGCLTCHANLRGPFTYEHSPVRTEGCQGCHEPHGSANPKMLTRAEVRFVCLECHANMPQKIQASATIGVVPPSFHDLRSARYRNCTICHQAIHGSHVDRNLTR